MKLDYIINGMTCNHCITTVKNALLDVNGVKDVSINLETSVASLTVNDVINLKTLQNALPKQYSIIKKDEREAPNTSLTTAENDKSIVKQLFPLFLIFGYLIVFSILLNYKPWSSTNFMLDFMGLFYIVFSFFKFLDLKGFMYSFKMYDPLGKGIPFYGFVYPFIELGLGLLFITRHKIVLALLLTLIILGITTIGVTKTLLQKKTIQCACLGTTLKLPMTKATFIENSIMIIMAILMLIKIYNL